MIVMGLDQHREQITYDALDTETGEVWRGRIRPADRDGLRRFLARFEGERLEVTIEATTGRRFVVEELVAAGHRPHLAEPAETSAQRGPKKRAKSDRADARHLRELLRQGRLPESWIPPEQILELRSLVRLRKAPVDQRTAWLQRIRAQLYHHGVPRRTRLLAAERRAWLESLELPAAARAQIRTALSMIDHIDAELGPLAAELRRVARAWPGARAPKELNGIGELTAPAVLAELGDAGRFSSARKAVRYAGLDITVHGSDSRRAPGHLSRQGPATLRWALFEAAQPAWRASSPDHDHYGAARERLGGNRASLSVARSFCAAPTTPCTSWARRRFSRLRRSMRASPDIKLMRCGQLPEVDCRHGSALRGLERLSGRNASGGITRSTIMSPASRPWTEISLGVRAHENHTELGRRAHGPPHPHPGLTGAPEQISQGCRARFRTDLGPISAIQSVAGTRRRA